MQPMKMKRLLTVFFGLIASAILFGIFGGRFKSANPAQVKAVLDVFSRSYSHQSDKVTFIIEKSGKKSRPMSFVEMNSLVAKMVVLDHSRQYQALAGKKSAGAIICLTENTSVEFQLFESSTVKGLYSMDIINAGFGDHSLIIFEDKINLLDAVIDSK